MLTRLVKLAPGIKERWNVTLLQRKDLECALNLVYILELLVDDRNEDIQEDEESEQLEEHPVEVRYGSFGICAVMHNLVPTLARRWADKNTDTVVEGVEVHMLQVQGAIVTLLDVSEKSHAGHSEREDDEHEEQSDICNVVHGEVECL